MQPRGAVTGLKANTELANTEKEALLQDHVERPEGSGSQSAPKAGTGPGSGDSESTRAPGVVSVSLCSGTEGCECGLGVLCSQDPQHTDVTWDSSLRVELW